MKIVNKKKGKMKIAMTNVKRVIATACTYLMFMATGIVNASGDESQTVQPQIVSGTIKLINDAIGWALLLTGGLTILISIIKGLQWLQAQEEERPRYAKAIKTTIIAGVIIMCIEGIVGLVFSYYK